MYAACAYSQQVTSQHLSLNRALSLCFYGIYVVKEKEKALFFGCNPSSLLSTEGVDEGTFRTAPRPSSACLCKCMLFVSVSLSDALKKCTSLGEFFLLGLFGNCVKLLYLCIVIETGGRGKHPPLIQSPRRHN